MTPLIDTTEMYLRTVWELEEEGITPIRARLVERLGLSAPAVSETVNRLADEGLMVVHDDRTLGLTPAGSQIAVSVMRKHRLAERLLTDVIGLDWEAVHNEACRWEHVISDAVESRLVAVLDDPAACPHGNPIPGDGPAPGRDGLLTIAEAAKAGQTASVARFSEMLQGDVGVMRALRHAGLTPGAVATFGIEAGVVVADVGGNRFEVPIEAADRVHVAPVDPQAHASVPADAREGAAPDADARP